MLFTCGASFECGLLFTSLLAALGVRAACWTATNFNVPSVGFHLGVDAGTAVIAYPDGTVRDVVSIRTNDSDRAWATRTVLQGSKEEFALKLPRRGASVIHTSTSSLGDVAGTRVARERPFGDMLGLLKQAVATEISGGDAIYTVSFPAWLDWDQRQAISASLQLAGINDSACHGDITSPSAAVWAYRQHQTSLLTGELSDIDCTHGFFGKETLIAIEHNEYLVAIQKSIILVGDDAAHSTESTDVKIFLKPVNDQDESTFWQNITEHLDELLSPIPPDTFRPDKVFRLVLSGSLTRDRNLLDAIAAAADDLLPARVSGREPLVARTYYPTLVRSQAYRENMQRRRESGSMITTDVSDPISRFYGNVLLHRVRKLLDTQGAEILDPQFVSARAAALMGIDSVLRPCSADTICSFENCPEKSDMVDGWRGEFGFQAWLHKDDLWVTNVAEHDMIWDEITLESKRRMAEVDPDAHEPGASRPEL